MGILCKLGIHRYRDTGKVTSIVIPVGLEQCSRCGVGRERGPDAIWHYSAAQMRLAMFHGTPEEFDIALLNALGEISVEEYKAASAKYRRQFARAAAPTGDSSHG